MVPYDLLEYSSRCELILVKRLTQTLEVALGPWGFGYNLQLNGSGVVKDQITIKLKHVTSCFIPSMSSYKPNQNVCHKSISITLLEY